MPGSFLHFFEGEMMVFVFFKAGAVGLALAAPVGPMALLCIRRTIGSGWRAGLATGAGIASGDALLAILAALGLASVSRFVLEHERVFHVIAGPVLVYLGLRTVLQCTAPSQASGELESLHASYVSSALLTFANPPTVIAFVALFTVIAPRDAQHFSTAFASVAGVGAGSLMWDGPDFLRRAVLKFDDAGRSPRNRGLFGDRARRVRRFAGILYLGVSGSTSLLLRTFAR